jgi:hypothetical protein
MMTPTLAYRPALNPTSTILPPTNAYMIVPTPHKPTSKWSTAQVDTAIPHVLQANSEISPPSYAQNIASCRLSPLQTPPQVVAWRSAQQGTTATSMTEPVEVPVQVACMRTPIPVCVSISAIQISVTTEMPMSVLQPVWLSVLQGTTVAPLPKAVWTSAPLFLKCTASTTKILQVL